MAVGQAYPPYKSFPAQTWITTHEITMKFNTSVVVFSLLSVTISLSNPFGCEEGYKQGPDGKAVLRPGINPAEQTRG